MFALGDADSKLLGCAGLPFQPIHDGRAFGDATEHSAGTFSLESSYGYFLAGIFYAYLVDDHFVEIRVFILLNYSFFR